MLTLIKSVKYNPLLTPHGDYKYRRYCRFIFSPFPRLTLQAVNPDHSFHNFNTK